MEKKRYAIKNTLGMYDLVKGFAMVMMMLAHTYGILDFVKGYTSLGEMINAYGPLVVIFLLFYGIVGQCFMPALFVVSGYGFRKTTIRKCVMKQVNTLLIPYMITAVLMSITHFFMYCIIYRHVRNAFNATVELFAGAVLGTSQEWYYFGHKFKECGPIWFLMALIVANIVFNFLLNHFEGKKLLIGSLLAAFIGWVLSRGILVPWCISQGLVATFFIYLGYWAKKSKLFTSLENNKKNISLLVVSMFATIAFSFGITQFNMPYNSYPFGMASIIANGLFGLFILYPLLYLNKFNGKVSTFFRTIGRYSIYVLCIHTIEMMGGGGYMQYNFAEQYNGSLLSRSLILFVSRVFVIIPATFIFIRIKSFIESKRRGA